ncbi:Transcriptional regulator XRE family, partial [Dysosmobacter welbionis]
EPPWKTAIRWWKSKRAPPIWAPWREMWTPMPPYPTTPLPVNDWGLWMGSATPAMLNRWILTPCAPRPAYRNPS